MIWACTRLCLIMALLLMAASTTIPTVMADRNTDCWNQGDSLGDCYGWGQCVFRGTNSSAIGDDDRWRCECSARRYEEDGTISYSNELEYPSCRYWWYSVASVRSWIIYVDVISMIIAWLATSFAIVVLRRLYIAQKLRWNLSTLAISCTGMAFFLTSLQNLLQVIRRDGYFAKASAPSHTHRASTQYPIEQFVMWLVETFPNVPLITAYNMVFLFWRRLSMRTLQPTSRVLDGNQLKVLAAFTILFTMLSIIAAIYDDILPIYLAFYLLWQAVLSCTFLYYGMRARRVMLPLIIAAAAAAHDKYGHDQPDDHDHNQHATGAVHSSNNNSHGHGNNGDGVSTDGNGHAYVPLPPPSPGSPITPMTPMTPLSPTGMAIAIGSPTSNNYHAHGTNTTNTNNTNNPRSATSPSPGLPTLNNNNATSSKRLKPSGTSMAITGGVGAGTGGARPQMAASAASMYGSRLPAGQSSHHDHHLSHYTSAGTGGAGTAAGVAPGHDPHTHTHVSHGGHNGAQPSHQRSIRVTLRQRRVAQRTTVLAIGGSTISLMQCIIWILIGLSWQNGNASSQLQLYAISEFLAYLWGTLMVLMFWESSSKTVSHGVHTPPPLHDGVSHPTTAAAGGAHGHGHGHGHGHAYATNISGMGPITGHVAPPASTAFPLPFSPTFVNARTMTSPHHNRGHDRGGSDDNGAQRNVISPTYHVGAQNSLLILSQNNNDGSYPTSGLNAYGTYGTYGTTHDATATHSAIGAPGVAGASGYAYGQGHHGADMIPLPMATIIAVGAPMRTTGGTGGVRPPSPSLQIQSMTNQPSVYGTAPVAVFTAPKRVPIPPSSSSASASVAPAPAPVSAPTPSSPLLVPTTIATETTTVTSAMNRDRTTAWPSSSITVA